MKKLITLLSFISLLLSEVTTAQVWEPLGDPLGISAGGAGRQSIVCDNNDNIIVGYYDTSIQKGSVQKYNAATDSWPYVGGMAGITSNGASFNSLSVNSQGDIYFLNQSSFPNYYHEARVFQNDAWTQLANVTNSSINYNSSAISEDDVLFAANNQNNGTVKKLVNGVWEQVGSSGFTNGVPFYFDMVIGSNDKIYVSFNNNGFLHVYENSINASSTEDWQPVGGIVDLAPAPSTEDYNSSLAIDSQNNLFVAYVSSSAEGYKLNAKKFDGTNWSQVGAQNFTDNRVKHTSIAIGANDIVYIAVSNWEDVDLLRNYVMAYDENSGAWEQAGSGFAGEGQGIFNSLAVDSFGNLYLSFTDVGLNKLSVKKLNLDIVAAESINITTAGNVPAEITTDNGTLQLNAEVFPMEASQDVIWSIESSGDFATVDSNGLVTAIASDAVITVKARAAENSSIFSTIDVTLTNQDSTIDAVEVIIETAGGGYPDISYPDIFGIGNTLQLNTVVLPLEADQDIIWSIEEGSDVINIDQSGMVTSIAEGYAVVRATHIDGNVFDEIRVNVFENGCSQGTIINNSGTGDIEITSNSGEGGTDNFVVPEDTRFELSKVRLRLRTQTVDVTSVTLNILADDDGVPGEVIRTIENIVPTSQTFIYDHAPIGKEYDVELNLPEALILNEGTYWISPSATAADGSFVNWALSPQAGNNFFISHPNHGWLGFGLDGLAGSYEITGNCTPMEVMVSTVSGDDAVIVVGETIDLEAIINTSGNTDITWSIVSGSGNVSLENNVTVTGIGVGTAVVRASLNSDTTYYDEIEITVLDPDGCGQGVPTNGQENAYVLDGIDLAVDITVEQGTQFKIQSITPSTAGYATNFQFNFYENDNGFPGNLITSVNGLIVYDRVTGLNFDYPFHRYIVELETEVILTEGTYWMQMECDAVGWEATSAGASGLALVFDQGSGWVYGANNAELVYNLEGVCQEVLNTPESDVFNFTSYPNPVEDYLNFSAESVINDVVVYDIRGLEIIKKSIDNTIGRIDFSNFSSGIYVVKVISGEKFETFKVLKK